MRRGARLTLTAAVFALVTAAGAVVAVNASADETIGPDSIDVTVDIAPGEAGRHARRISWHGCRGTLSAGQILYTSGAVRAFVKFVVADDLPNAAICYPGPLGSATALNVTGFAATTGLSATAYAQVVDRGPGMGPHYVSTNPEDHPGWASLMGRFDDALATFCSPTSNGRCLAVVIRNVH